MHPVANRCYRSSSFGNERFKPRQGMLTIRWLFTLVINATTQWSEPQTKPQRQPRHLLTMYSYVSRHCLTSMISHPSSNPSSLLNTLAFSSTQHILSASKRISSKDSLRMSSYLWFRVLSLVSLARVNSNTKDRARYGLVLRIRTHRFLPRFSQIWPRRWP